MSHCETTITCHRHDKPCHQLAQYLNKHYHKFGCLLFS